MLEALSASQPSGHAESIVDAEKTQMREKMDSFNNSYLLKLHTSLHIQVKYK